MAAGSTPWTRRGRCVIWKWWVAAATEKENEIWPATHRHQPLRPLPCPGRRKRTRRRWPTAADDRRRLGRHRFFFFFDGCWNEGEEGGGVSSSACPLCGPFFCVPLFPSATPATVKRGTAFIADGCWCCDGSRGPIHVSSTPLRQRLSPCAVLYLLVCVCVCTSSFGPKAALEPENGAQLRPFAGLAIDARASSSSIDRWWGSQEPNLGRWRPVQGAFDSAKSFRSPLHCPSRVACRRYRVMSRTASPFHIHSQCVCANAG